ncbi:hypothetical protein ABZP36_035721 [Zizania latifolia]
MDAALGLKRKDADGPGLGVDDVSASGFPVSSRATKIRRLDAEVPPVVPGVGVQPPPPPPRPVEGLGVAEVPMCGDEVPVAVAPAPNEERAIVLYSPADAARNLLLGPLRPDAPLRVSPDWIHGLKSTMLRETTDHRALFALARDESSNLAMVPWVPSHSQEASTAAAAMAAEMMDAEDTEATPMEVEQDGASHPGSAGVAQQGESQAPYQWPQHCMVQQPLPAASYQPSPVTWSW